MAAIKYGLPTPTEAAGKSDRETLQAIIDGELPPAPISEISPVPPQIDVGGGLTSRHGCAEVRLRR